MTPKLVTVRCREDNYDWLLHTGQGTILFDATEAGPVREALDARGWPLTDIALTHHHEDHIAAVAELARATGARVWGAAADARRLPQLDRAVRPGDAVTLAGLEARVIEAGGHTIGHIAWHLPEVAIAFTGDSLMALGCGRIFEGDAPMMWDSLQRLADLPDETLICSGHDYCGPNGAFALAVDADNPALRARLAGIGGALPCAPVTLATEKATNPFLRAAALAAALGMAGEAHVKVFAHLRAMRDSL